MTTIFISGSREIPYIPESVQTRIDKMIECEFNIVVGDSERGVDAGVLRYLVSRTYPNVTIFTIHGKPRVRCILDCWQTQNVEPKVAEKLDSSGKARNRRELETEKDRAMGQAADYGLVVWKSSYKNRYGCESASKGSLRNMHQMLSSGKPVVLYKTAKSELSGAEVEFSCYELRTVEDLVSVVDNEPDVVKKAFEEIKKRFAKAQSQLPIIHQ